MATITNNNVKFFQSFDLSKDIVSNPTKVYQTKLDLGSTAVSPQTGQYKKDGIVFATGYATSAANSVQYASIQSLLRKSNNNGPWKPVITGAAATNIVVISFTNTLIGDRIKSDGFHIIYNSTDLYAVPYSKFSGLGLDIKPQYHDSCALLFDADGQTSFGDGINFKGLLFTQLGLILLYSDSPLTLGSITPTNIVKQQIFNSKTFFCRLTNQKFNASNNNTWVQYNVSLNIYQIRNGDDIFTCPTTIGLYNDNDQLLAIAKLSEPVFKQMDSQLHVQVVLQY